MSASTLYCVGVTALISLSGPPSTERNSQHWSSPPQAEALSLLCPGETLLNRPDDDTSSACLGDH